MKRYFRKNCGYTFEMLKTNVPSALWEHHMHMWMEAYWSGLEMKEAQLQVREFSLKKYKSDRRVPETVASLLTSFYLYVNFTANLGHVRNFISLRFDAMKISS